VTARWDNLEAAVSPGQPAPSIPRQRQPHPAGWEPGIAWDGTQGSIATGPLEAPPATWDDLFRRWNLDPAEVEIIEPVQRRSWEAQTKTGEVVQLNYFKANIRRRSSTATADEIVKAISSRKRRKTVPPSGEMAFLVLAGDTQFGKPDGGGTAGIVERFQDKTELAVARLRELRKAGRSIGPVYLPWLGDCIEGYNSQGGRNVWRTDLTLTEMVRVYRRMLLWQIDQFAPHTERLVVPVVPGNHDEAVRVGDKMGTRYDDSWAVEGAVAVADAMRLNPAVYGHVSVVVPAKDELTLTLDVAGTVTGMAHGHQTKGNAEKWWAEQAHGCQPIGDATLLLTGHYHHFRAESPGAKTWVQIPALDGGSTWFRHRAGHDAPPGMVTMVVGAGSWSGLEVL
jgi:predicted phosphodiesterase